MRGIAASPGSAVGPVHQVRTTTAEPAPQARPAGSSADAESARAAAAAEQVAAALQTAAADAVPPAGDILAATAEMAADPALAAAVRTGIEERSLSAERAVWEACTELAARLGEHGGYLGERTADVIDVRDRIIAALHGRSTALRLPEHPVVLIAESLAPADTADLDASRVRALVMTGGGPQSHAAILARSLGIPAVVGAEAAVTSLPEGTEVFVDGDAGCISTAPDPAQRAQADAWQQARSRRPAFTGQAATADGQPVMLLANIGSLAEAERAADAGAQGVGLLRTEFLFLDREDEPSIAEQAEVYAAILSCFAEQPVTIRTLDAGSDKPLPFLPSSPEPNPALGMRGFRTHARAPEVLTRQLTAIAQAAAGTRARVKVMAPMITTAAEAADFASLVTAAGLPEAGIMVETPAAALCAAAVLAPVSFASIGTNDLTQYVLAFDRELAAYGGLQSPAHPAVLALIAATVRGAAGRPVGVCGEAAADPQLAVLLAGLGVESLSMTPSALGPVAEALAGVSLHEAQERAAEAIAGTAVAQPVPEPADASGPETIARTLTVTAPTGLHARPAAVLAKALRALDARVRIRTQDASADGASIMEMMALGAEAGDEILVEASGPEAAAAVAAVAAAAGGDA